VTRARAPVALAVPAVAAIALVLLPLAYLILRAGGGGLDALRVLERPGTVELVFKTGLLVAAVTAAAIAVGLPLAWLVARSDLPGRRLIGVAAPLPLVIPSYVAALALIGALGPRGLLQRLLEGPFGVERIPEIYGFVGAWLALTLSTYPYVFLLAVAALRGVDPSLEEAARGLGQSRWAVFRRVTLPALRPSLGAASLLVALYALSDFGAVSLMQYDALTRSIYLQYRSLFDRTPAAVLALVLVALTIVLLILEERSRRGVRLHRSASGVRPAQIVPLGRWRWPAFAFCVGVMSFFLVVPIAVLVYWSARAVDLGHGISFAWEAALSSLSVSALAAAAAVLAVLPVAFLGQRYTSGWTRALERLAFTGNALPGIVIALSLVFFAANYVQPLYQTLALLVFAYVVRFFPQALAGVGSALHAVNPRVEEAARSLGRGPVRVLVTVTVPLIRRGVLVGAALVFLNAMKELPATLLLRPTGFETLATEIWKYTSLGSYSRAAPPALLLILVSAPVVYLLASRRGSEVTAPG
jgi:iron(III) transport system permease protein